MEDARRLLLLLGCWSVSWLISLRLQPVGAQGDPGPGWGQVIQWENNGRFYSLLNSGSQFLPAGQQPPRRHHHHPRVWLAGSSRGGHPRAGGTGRRQAPTQPVRGGSETVRGQTRHPFGFGQVPDNWRQGTFGDASNTRRYQPAVPRQDARSRQYQPESFADTSFAQPPYPRYPAAQPPYSNPYEPGYEYGGAPRGFDGVDEDLP